MGRLDSAMLTRAWAEEILWRCLRLLEIPMMVSQKDGAVRDLSYLDVVNATVDFMICRDLRIVLSFNHITIWSPCHVKNYHASPKAPDASKSNSCTQGYY